MPYFAVTKERELESQFLLKMHLCCYIREVLHEAPSCPEALWPILAHVGAAQGEPPPEQIGCS